MRITFLGTGSAINTSSPGASILINKNILIDAPGGISQALQKSGGDINKMNAIIITHLHGDHVFGLPFLLLEFILKPRDIPLNILAPSGTRMLISRLTHLAFPDLDYKQVQRSALLSYTKASNQKRIPIKDIFIKPQRVPHGDIEAYGIEIWEYAKKKIFYAPDVSYCSQLVKIIEKVDIAILDATTQDIPIQGHMSMRQVSELAKQFPSKSFILTHRSNYNIQAVPFSIPDNLLVPNAGDTLFVL